MSAPDLQARARAPRTAAERIPVTVLGSTGLVGQHLLRRLVDHPWFRIGELIGSDRSAGRLYGESVEWVIGGELPDDLRDRPVAALSDGVAGTLVLSALPGSVAARVEPELARAGKVVCTNASAHRATPVVPLIVPEVNADAIGRLGGQPWRAAGGAIVANPNCVVTGVALALAPIHRRWGISAATIVTLQALSGAGVHGTSGLAVAGNVVPWIEGEEEKIGTELSKILDRRIAVAVAVNRVPVVDGHVAHVFLRLDAPARMDDMIDALDSFRGPEEIRGLPSLPDRPLRVHHRVDRPQPRLDADADGGMSVAVGRIRRAPPWDLGLVVVSHNAIRGAAGACLLNAELCVASGQVRLGAGPPVA